MITLEQYFGRWIHHPDATDQRKENAVELLEACATLEAIAKSAGVHFPDNQITESGVSGDTYGGFRPQSCPQGAPSSSHKEGQGVDRFDPKGEIDDWCMKNAETDGALAQCGIYIEHPDSTPHWSHWTTRAPASGHRVFKP